MLSTRLAKNEWRIEPVAPLEVCILGRARHLELLLPVGQHNGDLAIPEHQGMFGECYSFQGVYNRAPRQNRISSKTNLLPVPRAAIRTHPLLQVRRRARAQCWRGNPVEQTGEPRIGEATAFQLQSDSALHHRVGRPVRDERPHTVSRDRRSFAQQNRFFLNHADNGIPIGGLFAIAFFIPVRDA